MIEILEVRFTIVELRLKKNQPSTDNDQPSTTFKTILQLHF